MQDEETQKEPQKGKTVKRYFWLKLKEEFFQDKEIKKLRRIAGGDTYTIIYLKLMLLSLKSDGRLYFDGIEDTFYEELALDIDEDPENVKVTLMYLEKMGLIQLINEDEMYLTQMNNLILSESESAKRVRAHRAKKKLIEDANGQLELPIPQDITDFDDSGNDNEALHGNSDVTECNADETNCNTYTDTYTDTNTDTELKTDSNSKGKKRVKQFVKPTEEEVDAYCIERGNGITGFEFVAHYDSNGWMVGKTPMKDWKGAVRTWEAKRGFKYVKDNKKNKGNTGQLKRELQ